MGDGRAGDEELFWPDVDLDLAGATLIDFGLTGCRVRTATFDRAHFAGDVSFSGTQFAGDVRFTNSRFVSRRADLRGVWFAGKADFVGAGFAGDAEFTGSKFGVKYAEPYHYIGPEPAKVEDYIKKNAVKL